MKFNFFFLTLLWIGCVHEKSFVRITDEYIEVKNDPKLGVIYEIEVKKIDSIFKYPIEETVVSIYSIVDRRTKKLIKGSPSIKLYFSKHYKEYYWRIMYNPTIVDYIFQDTFVLKKKRWYKIRNENDRNELYFFWSGIKGNYITKIKPFPPSGPW